MRWLQIIKAQSEVNAFLLPGVQHRKIVGRLHGITGRKICTRCETNTGNLGIITGWDDNLMFLIKSIGMRLNSVESKRLA